MKKIDETKNQIQALTKGLSVLECFKDSDEYGVTEVGQIVGLPESSVQRIVNTIEMMGYLYQNPLNRKYRLSPRVLQIYNKSLNLLKWKDLARRHMLALNERFGESVNLAVRDQDKCSYIELVESRHHLRPYFTLNDSYPLHCTSLGRSLLSDLADDLILSLMPDPIPQLTPMTIVDRKKVLEKIKEIRQHKYAIDDEEFYLGLVCVGGPVFGVGDKVVAALSVTAPKVRMTPEVIAEIVPAVLGTTQRISEEYMSIFG
jgi:DNA-binding IclR family transcriptional regulator